MAELVGDKIWRASDKSIQTRSIVNDLLTVPYKKEAYKSDRMG